MDVDSDRDRDRDADGLGQDACPPPRRIGRRTLRWAVNLWLVLHVSAIIIAPASVTPSSDLARTAWDVVHPYLQLLFLNHGYHFFAPEPAESTLLGYVAEREDGTVVTGQIPNRDIGPRLLYHRHFMLSEHMAGTDPELRELWHESFARHIGTKYGADRVSLSQITHYLPTREMVLEGVRLDDPASYVEQPLGVYQWDEQ
ncbi:hypothetical protein [Tautonia marina]|uniref:hypothetical protein n=1 Tax=Tautonia marina TaxID=2653855 RepID=UPI00126114CE|nr:hypothetical protein [Tautonia marina]